MQNLYYNFHFGKILCNSSNTSDSHCGSLSFGLGYYFLKCCYEWVLETLGPPLNKLLLLYTKTEQQDHG